MSLFLLIQMLDMGANDYEGSHSSISDLDVNDGVCVLETSR